MRDKLLLIILLFICSILGISYAEDNSTLNLQPLAAPNNNHYTIDDNYKVVYNPLVNSDDESKLPHLYALNVNGIGTTEDEAEINKERLQTLSQLQSGRNYVTWDVVYNPTAEVVHYGNESIDVNRMLFTNLWDTIYHQKNNELSLNNMMSVDDYLNGLLTNTNVSPEAREALREMILPDYQSLIKQYSGRNINELVDRFHEKVPVRFASVLKRIGYLHESGDINNYKREPIAVMLIAHSQGNLYSNELYQYLTLSENFDKHHLAIVGIASPAEKNLADWPISESSEMATKLRKAMPTPPTGYVTSCDDSVINLLRKEEFVRHILLIFNIILPGSVEIPGVAQCNDTSAQGGEDSRNHSLISYYLHDDNIELQQRIVANINYFAYVLDYNLMKDLNYNMMPDNAGFNKYPQTLAFIIGDAKANDAQNLMTSGGTKIWGYKYDWNKNPSGFLYVEEPLLDEYMRPLMHFVAAPSKAIVGNGYDPKLSYSVYEDTKRGRYNFSIIYPFYIYPYTEEYSGDTDYDKEYTVDAYPWNYNSWEWPWNPSADGTCRYAGWHMPLAKPGTSFANLKYGIEVWLRNPRYDDLWRCFDMPPEKYTDGFWKDGWWNNIVPH